MAARSSRVEKRILGVDILMLSCLNATLDRKLQVLSLIIAMRADICSWGFVSGYCCFNLFIMVDIELMGIRIFLRT